MTCVSAGCADGLTIVIAAFAAAVADAGHGG